MKKIIEKSVWLGVVLIIACTGCTKDVTIVYKSTETITKTVSFSNDLAPIFTKNCALGGCHADGGQKPDLAQGKAYNSIISMSLADTSKPTTSIIYERLTGVLTPAMPLNGTSDPSNIDALILAWIKQGAKNN